MHSEKLKLNENEKNTNKDTTNVDVYCMLCLPG